jgi:hypothetical protein
MSSSFVDAVLLFINRAEKSGWPPHCGMKPQCGCIIIKSGCDRRDDASDFCSFQSPSYSAGDVLHRAHHRADLSPASDRGVSCSSLLLALFVNFLVFGFLFRVVETRRSNLTADSAGLTSLFFRFVCSSGGSICIPLITIYATAVKTGIRESE